MALLVWSPSGGKPLYCRKQPHRYFKLEMSILSWQSHFKLDDIKTNIAIPLQISDWNSTWNFTCEQIHTDTQGDKQIEWQSGLYVEINSLQFKSQYNTSILILRQNSKCCIWSPWTQCWSKNWSASTVWSEWWGDRYRSVLPLQPSWENTCKDQKLNLHSLLVMLIIWK